VRRREFIAGLGAAAWPLAARAQQPALPVVAVLTTDVASGTEVRGRLLNGLRDTGFVERQNVVLEIHYAEARYDRLLGMAADLVARRVAVIVTIGAVNAALAAKQATTTIPIVFIVGSNPVEIGLVESLNRPGGNVTGLTMFAHELLSKRLALLRELRPAAQVIGMLVDEKNPNAGPEAHEMQAIANAGGWRLEVVPINSDEDREPAFATLARLQAGGVFYGTNSSFNARPREIIVLAARYGLPMIYNIRSFVEAGGLMSYGSSLDNQHRQAGNYVGRILKGEKPADLPVIQPARFELVINLQTARTLGIEVPPQLLAIADEVIQ
jgi:putative tryptophan/tyrosine transport system substrate-binding protein